MQIDQHSYRKSLPSKVFWKILLFIGFIYIFFKMFSGTINTYWVDGVLKHFPTTTFSTALCLLTLLYAVFKIKQAVHYRLLPKLASLVFILALTLFYVGVVRIDQAYFFYSIDKLHFAWLKYADLFFISFCVIIIEFRSYNKPLDKQSPLSLTADEPDPANTNDLIKSQSYVQRIAETINATACKMSFSIGVFSAWGSGKTDFLIRLKKVLETKPDENVVIDFNPWKAATTESVMDDFFTVLSNALRPYNRSIIPTIKTYSKKILAPGKDIQYRLLDTITDEFAKDKSLEEKYNSINDSIRSTGKRFIIIIDDLDRMTGLEVMQVFRIIRNSASFDNTFFIVAMDHQYIVNVLEKTNLFSNEEQYLKKIFQLTITLPSIRKETFSEEIKRLLIHENMQLRIKIKFYGQFLFCNLVMFILWSLIRPMMTIT